MRRVLILHLLGGFCLVIGSIACTPPWRSPTDATPPLVETVVIIQEVVTATPVIVERVVTATPGSRPMRGVIDGTTPAEGDRLSIAEIRADPFIRETICVWYDPAPHELLRVIHVELPLQLNQSLTVNGEPMRLVSSNPVMAGGRVNRRQSSVVIMTHWDCWELPLEIGEKSAVFTFESVGRERVKYRYEWHFSLTE